VNNSPY